MKQHFISRRIAVGATFLCLLVAGGAVTAQDLDARSDDAAVLETMKASFKAKGQAGMDRLTQTPAQKTCSAHGIKPMSAAAKSAMEKEALAQVKYPSDGKYIGDWKKGMKLASKGKGFQFSDKPGSQVYGNCYACHQLDLKQVSYGNMGPSLNAYGKLRGDSEAVRKYTWARIWNSHAFNACNAMPRFGASGILTEAQIKDVMALLLDPNSPVNQ